MSHRPTIVRHSRVLFLEHHVVVWSHNDSFCSAEFSRRSHHCGSAIWWSTACGARCASTDNFALSAICCAWFSCLRQQPSSRRLQQNQSQLTAKSWSQQQQLSSEFVDMRTRWQTIWWLSLRCSETNQSGVECRAPRRSSTRYTSVTSCRSTRHRTMKRWITDQADGFDGRIIGQQIERIYFVFIGHNYCTQNEVWLLRVSFTCYNNV